MLVNLIQRRKKSWKHCAPCGVDKNELAEDHDERYLMFIPEEDKKLNDNDFVAFMDKSEKNSKAQLARTTEWEKREAEHVARLNVNGL